MNPEKLSDHDVLKDLEAALAVRPSPEFAARVRSRIQREAPAPRYRLEGSLAAAAVVVIAGASFIVWRSQDGPARPAAARTDAALLASAPAIGGGLPSGAPPAEVARTLPPAAATPKPERVAHAKEPLVLVAPDQAMALAQFLRDLAEGRIDPGLLAVVEPVRVDAPALEALKDVAPVTVTPVAIPLIDDAAGRAGTSGGSSR